MDNYSFLGAANTAFFEQIYQQYLTEPDSVESSWRSFFQVLILQMRYILGSSLSTHTRFL